MSAELFPVAILAGGLATRLRPVTEKIPKALVDINGEPFIAHQFRLLREGGARRVVVCAGYRGEMIQEVVGDGGRFGLEVKFAFDGPKLLGTAGALKRALPLLGEAFHILYGDSYLNCDFRAIQETFIRSAKQGLMTVFRNEGLWDKSNIELENGQIIVYDKHRPTPRMKFIDYGWGVLRAAALERVAADEPYDLARLYQDLLREGELAAFEVHERFYEIGSFEGLEETRRYLAEQKAAKSR